MKRVAIYTNDKARYRRTQLILRFTAEVVPCGAPCDVIITDGYAFPYTDGCILLPEGPISFEWLISEVTKSEGERKKRISTNGSTREVTKGEMTVTLTDVEYRLFSALFSRDGFVKREELTRLVWGDSAGDGVLNVYIHYLREKLEADGERVILSSRREGYSIDGKYERITVC